jgi:hypothetical protein
MRPKAKSVTRDDALFRLIGLGNNGIPGGVSGKKHEYLARAYRPHEPMSLPSLLRERRVLVDSSVYLALLDTDDEHHRHAREILNQLAHARYRQFTTDV